MKHKDGTWIWVHDLGQVIEWTPDGQPLWMFGTHTDITKIVEEREKNAMLQRFFDISPELMFILDPKHEIWRTNESWQTLLGYPETQLKQKNFYDLIHQNDVEKIKEKFQNVFNEAASVLNEAATVQVTAQIRQFDGSYRSIEWIFQSHGRWLYCTGRDISKESELEKQIENFLNVNLDMLCVNDQEGKFLRINQRFEEVLGYPIKDLIGHNFIEFIHPDDLLVSLEILKTLNKEVPIYGFVNRYRCLDGTYKFIEWNSLPGSGQTIYSSARDVSKSRLLEEQLRLNAMKDDLTDLYNRHFLETTIDEMMQHADRHSENLSIILLDIDFFKDVNDTFGHPVGDELLCHIADVIKSSIRKDDILVRFGGEEFVVMLPQTDLEKANSVAEKIRLTIEGTPLSKIGIRTASFGVSEHLKYESFRHWYRRVDDALYRAKQEGRNRVILSTGNEKLPLNTLGLAWKTEWESGNSSIDAQHQSLFVVGNNLLQLDYDSAENEIIVAELKQMLRDIKNHFAYEEDVLLNCRYVDLFQHKKHHQDLLNKANHLFDAFLQGEVKASAFFSYILDDMILGHLSHEDTKFFKYL